jgi:hypothetical protein
MAALIAVATDIRSLGMSPRASSLRQTTRLRSPSASGRAIWWLIGVTR